MPTTPTDPPTPGGASAPIPPEWIAALLPDDPYTGTPTLVAASALANPFYRRCYERDTGRVWHVTPRTAA